MLDVEVEIVLVIEDEVEVELAVEVDGENKFDINTSNYVSGPSTCIYPTLVKHNSYLNLMWVNYNKLYTACSDNLGKTWSEHEKGQHSISYRKSRRGNTDQGSLALNRPSYFDTHSVLKECPHEQLFVTLGLLILKPEPIRLST